MNRKHVVKLRGNIVGMVARSPWDGACGACGYVVTLPTRGEVESSLRAHAIEKHEANRP